MGVGVHFPFQCDAFECYKFICGLMCFFLLLQQLLLGAPLLQLLMDTFIFCRCRLDGEKKLSSVVEKSFKSE